MSDILLSIVIPAYNAERFLHDLLSVLVEQVFECIENSIEVIIINDGSADATADIAQTFSEKYSFISLINQDNKGECGARNTGIKNAKGRYIYFLDSDDTIPKRTLFFFQDVLSRHEITDIFVFGYEVQRNGVVSKTVFADSFDKRSFSAGMIKKLFLSKKLPLCICSIIYRNAFFAENDLLFPVGVKIGGDMVFMVNSFTKACTLQYNKRVSFTYQIRDDSVMQGYKGYNTDRIKAFEVIRDAVLKNYADYSSIEKEANFFIANTYLSNLVAYLKSDLKDNEINKIFLDNKFFLYRSLQGRFLNTVAICIARCMPLRILFKLLK